MSFDGVFCSDYCAIMDFSIDNPSFSNVPSVTVMDDAPKSSGSSSSSSGSSHFCIKCNGRMSSFDRDKHLTCVRCRGYDCCVESVARSVRVGLRRRCWLMLKSENHLLPKPKG